MTLTVADMPSLEREVADDAPITIRGSARGADCANCPFSRLGNPHEPVFGEGWDRPNWIIVGEGPGQNEVIHRRPFVGASGRLVNDALAKLGIAREAIFVTNTMLCQPPHGTADPVKKLARQACSGRLKQELAQFPSIPVLALGAHAAQALTGDEKFSITQMAGSFYEVDVDDSGIKRPVIPSIHPAAILRGGTSSGGGGSHTVDLAFWNLLYDAQKVNLLAKGVDIKFTDDIQVEFESHDRARDLVAAIVADIRRLRKFACDTETFVENPKEHTALSPVNAQMSALGIATTERAISIAWELCGPDVLTPLDEVFADPTITKVFHNRIYDIPVLERHGFVINGPIQCTMLMHHSAFPGLSHQLQRVTTQFFAAPPWKAEYRHGQGSLSDLLPYNARDTLATARIEGPISVVIKRSQAEQTYETDLAMAQAASMMHVKGVPIDRDINEQLRIGFRDNIVRSKQELDDRISDPHLFERFKERLAFEQARRTRKHDPIDLDSRIQKRLDNLEARMPDFMIDSGDHIVAFLRACGVPLSLQTPSGRLSTKKEVLEAYIQFPEIRALISYRENAKLLSTFCERMFTRIYGNKTVFGFADANSRVHPRWSVHKITGRWGSEGPQMQNWSKADPKKGRPNLRTQVVAPPGRAFVAFDAKQLEARLIALMSGDQFLLDIFKNDKDIHTEFAKIVWPEWDSVPVGERKIRRDIIKRPEYCLAPSTRVLKSDLTWVPIETLKQGDELIGFSAAKPGDVWTENYFESSIVRRTKSLRQPCYRIKTTEGEIIASDEHLWVGRLQNKGRNQRWVGGQAYRAKNWVRTDELRAGDILTFTSRPWIEDYTSWSAGYLAGLYDGEGWIGRNKLGFAQNPGTVLEIARQLVTAHKFKWHVTNRTQQEKIVRTEIKGGLWECLRFIGTIQPRRQRDRAESLWKGRRLRGKGNGARVISVECIGVRDVIALQTSTETFIAEGFLSHNCSFYAGSVETAWKSVVRDYPNVTIGMIGKMVQMMKTRMPGVTAWHQNMMRMADQQGEIRSMILGRRRCFPIKQFDLSEVVNFPIQSSGADIINLGLRDTMKRLPKTAFPIVQIHDAVVFECDEDDQDLMKKIVVECFTRDVTYNGNTMHFPVDAKVGKSWAEVN